MAADGSRMRCWHSATDQHCLAEVVPRVVHVNGLAETTHVRGTFRPLFARPDWSLERRRRHFFYPRTA